MDDRMPDVIIASSNTCHIHDANNGNSIISYKDVNTFLPKTLSLIGEDFLIGACSNKPMLKVWRIKKKKQDDEASFVVPGIVSALAVSSCGSYCIAGIQEKIYVWEVPTGDILNELSRHYQSVTCLKFTADDSRFLSGGKDGQVIVWILSDVIDVNARSHKLKPQHLWHHHSAEVTDMYCTKTISRVATTSLDMTCKVYELDSGILLTTISMDVSLSAVVMDPLEYYIFLGDEQGHLYRINTYAGLPHEIHRADLNNKVALKLHETKVISLDVSFDGKQLMTASEDGSCKLWDIQSMACLLSLRFDGALANAFFAMKPPCLSDESVTPRLFVRPFKKDTSHLAKNVDKKYIEANLSRQELSLIYEGCPDKYYDQSVFCSKPGKMVEAMNASAFDDVFDDVVNGETKTGLRIMNQQLFTVGVITKMDMSFPNPPSPS